MESPNRMALDLVDEAIDFAEELNIGHHHLANQAALLDFGVEYSGGIEAGLLLAEIETGGLTTVQARVGTVDGVALTYVDLATDHPTVSLRSCQAAEWVFEIDGHESFGSGPAQLLRRQPGGDGEPIEDGQMDFAVLSLRSPRLPDESVIQDVASATGVPSSAVFVLVTPPTSIAGGVAYAARAAERAVRRLETIGYDPGNVRSAHGVAPVAPLANTAPEAGERAAAAIADGGRVHLITESDVTDPQRLVRPGADSDRPLPAQVTVDVVGGATHVAGSVDEQRLAETLDLGA